MLPLPLPAFDVSVSRGTSPDAVQGAPAGETVMGRLLEPEVCATTFEGVPSVTCGLVKSTYRMRSLSLSAM